MVPEEKDEQVRRIQQWLDEVGDNAPERDPRDAAAGRARFLTQARDLAGAQSAPDPSTARRASTRRKVGFLGLAGALKPQWSLSMLAAALLLALAAALIATQATPRVSAQQILDRAAAAQAAAQTAAQTLSGVLHSRVEIFTNPTGDPGPQAGSTTIVETYLDTASARYRSVTRDPRGKVLEASAMDGQYTYSTVVGSDPLVVQRAPLDEDTVAKMMAVAKMTAVAKQAASAADTGARLGVVDPQVVFDQFRSNPRVEVLGRQTAFDGSPAIALIDRNYRSQKDSTEAVYTGAMKMFFDAQTYQLRETELTRRNGDQEIVLQSVHYWPDETLPDATAVTWDFSDLSSVTVVDAPESDAAESGEAPSAQTLSAADLAAHAHTYKLDPLPAGWSARILAQSDQPADQPFEYEIYYTAQGQDVFSVQAVGWLEPGFVDLNFYDSSYQAASGATLYYSTSGHSGMLTTPDGVSFLVFSELPRPQIEALIETFLPAKQ